MEEWYKFNPAESPGTDQGNKKGNNILWDFLPVLRSINNQDKNFQMKSKQVEKAQIAYLKKKKEYLE